MLLKIVLFLVLAGIVFLGARRIWRDWRGEAKRLDAADRKRDLRERAHPNVVTLKRDKDGKFRPD